jgi:putative peptidoglycan lipid II flippase
VFAARLVPANLGLGAALYGAAGHIDWIGLQAHGGQRAATMAGVLVASSLIYFALLAVCGLRPRHLARGG